MPIIKEDPMRSYDAGTFAFKSVKGEVKDAMHFDWKRDKVDDAKKRAIYQAPTYDDFKQRVAGCTLKPIHKDEFNKPPKFVFNKNSGAAEGMAPPVTGEIVGAVGGGYVTAASASKGGPQLRSSQRLPKTGHEFEREFRRCADSAEMVALLQRLDHDACARLFSRAIDAEVLRKALLALDEVSEPGAARAFLTALAVRCPISAAHAATFFDATERELVARLLARDRAEDPADDVAICASLSVPPALVAAAAARMTTAMPAPMSTAARSVPEEAVSPKAPARGVSDDVADTTGRADIGSGRNCDEMD
jgi:hypothetical protein